MRRVNQPDNFSGIRVQEDHERVMAESHELIRSAKTQWTQAMLLESYNPDDSSQSSVRQRRKYGRNDPSWREYSLSDN